MADFLPKYVFTLSNPVFKKIEDNIIIIGKEDGLIYSRFSNKDDLFEKMKGRVNRKDMMCIYKKNITFTENEFNKMWAVNVYPMSEKQVEQCRKGFNDIFSIVRM